jgi:hypothetical protein
MEYDKGKVDEYTLALLFLVMHDEKEHGAEGNTAGSEQLAAGSVVIRY